MWIGGTLSRYHLLLEETGRVKPVVVSYPQKVRTSTSAVSEADVPTHARRHDLSRRDDDDGVDRGRRRHAAYLSLEKKTLVKKRRPRADEIFSVAVLYGRIGVNFGVRVKKRGDDRVFFNF